MNISSTRHPCMKVSLSPPPHCAVCSWTCSHRLQCCSHLLPHVPHLATPGHSVWSADQMLPEPREFVTLHSEVYNVEKKVTIITIQPMICLFVIFCGILFPDFCYHPYISIFKIHLFLFGIASVLLNCLCVQKIGKNLEHICVC